MKVVSEELTQSSTGFSLDDAGLYLVSSSLDESCDLQAGNRVAAVSGRTVSISEKHTVCDSFQLMISYKQ